VIKRFGVLLLLTTIYVLAFSATRSVNAQATPASAPNPAEYRWIQFVNRFDSPVYVTNAGDGSGRLFIVEQGGMIFVVKSGVVQDKPFLDVTPLIIDDVIKAGYTERGLLGLAFHPNYARNGLFFIFYSNPDGDSVLARYKVSATDPDQADPASATVLLTIKQPNDTHKAGQLAFGPDGFLYVGSGDGGSTGDPQGLAQNKSSLLGKILRIDVNADTYAVPPSNPFVGLKGYAPEIWALGLRNPWRFSFDSATGDLYISDVGEDKSEELDFQPASSKGGENYGWNFLEGKQKFSPGSIPTGLTSPVYTYDHSAGCAIVGGYVYRGKALPALQGAYLFGDYCNGHIWSAYRDSAGAWQVNAFAELGTPISSFAVDEQGEIYAVGYKGTIYRLQSS
jgi:glucose/arabinose dehydrogenase